MKVAVISQDGKSVSQHFGRAPYYVVLTVENGETTAREIRPKAGHHSFAGAEPAADVKHETMAGPIADCEALIAGGMGEGAFVSLQAMGIRPILTDETDADQAGLRYARGDLPNLVDRVHGGHGHHPH
jgi:predicted Fe-Mo cluster-binding NifX family protein